MELTENELRNIVNKLVAKLGVDGAKLYISTGEYSKELKKLALSMLEQKTIDESLMGENGDVSDFGI